MKIKIQGDIPKHIMDEIEKLKPSSDPSYWAKSGCKDCNGRGIIGMQKTKTKGDNIITGELLCGCARKKYKTWIDKKEEEIRLRLNGGTLDSVEEASKDSVAKGNGKKSKDNEKILRSKLSSLEEAISSIRIEIAREDLEINSYPQHSILNDISVRQKSVEEDLKKICDEVDELDRKANVLMERSQRLMTAAKSLSRDADIVKQEKTKIVATILSEKNIELHSIKSDYRSVEKELNSMTHKAKKRRRIAQDRLEKLLERRQRVIREAGFDPGTFTEFIALESEDTSPDSQV